MSPLALQLASQKLRQDNLVMLATIINQKVVFEKLEPVDPSIVESDDRESWSLISLPGYHPGKWLSLRILLYFRPYLKLTVVGFQQNQWRKKRP